MPAPNEITVAQLNRLIGTPDCPQIVDVCTEADFAEDPFLIPGSFRHSHTDLPALAARLQDRRVIIACQKGKKLSQGVASWLRGAGYAAEVLQGGVYAWREMTGTMRIPGGIGPGSLWVTRHRPKIDRIACPWLIRRFVDPGARFLFVSPGAVLDVADKFGATPFDVDGAPFTHRGVDCTFDDMLGQWGLDSAPLRILAEVVRGADTGELDTHPVAAGLLAMSVGLSRLYRDDHAQLEAGLALYDALYRWARDGQGEAHSHDA